MFSIPMKFTVTTNIYLEDKFGNTKRLCGGMKYERRNEVETRKIEGNRVTDKTKGKGFPTKTM